MRIELFEGKNSVEAKVAHKKVNEKSADIGAPNQLDAEKKANTDVDAVQRSEKWILVMLQIAALVCGWMCFQGALQIFSGHMITAFAFAVVVQGVILLTLWQMALRPLRQRVVLLFAWLVCASFSTGAAFFYADKNNWESVVADAKSSVITYVQQIEGKFAELEQSEAAKRLAAKTEAGRGGCGRICRGHQDAADEAASKVQAAQAAKAAAQNALSELNAMDDKTASLQDVRGVFNKVRAAAGSLGEGLREPEVGQTLNFFERVGYVYSVILGLHEGKDGERFKFGLTLGLASLLEILGFILAILHMMNHAKTDDRPLGQRLAQLFGRIKNTENLFKNAEAYRKVEQDEVSRDIADKALPPAAKSRPSGREEREERAETETTLRSKWARGISAQAKIESSDERGLIESLLPGMPAMPNGSGLTAFFDSKVFNDKSALRVTLVITGVLEMSSQGLKAGKNWTAWLEYLVTQLDRLQTLPKGRKGLLRAIGT
jgi:hypothetical protein